MPLPLLRIYAAQDAGENRTLERRREKGFYWYKGVIEKNTLSQ